MMVVGAGKARSNTKLWNLGVCVPARCFQVGGEREFRERGRSKFVGQKVVTKTKNMGRIRSRARGRGSTGRRGPARDPVSDSGAFFIEGRSRTLS